MARKPSAKALAALPQPDRIRAKILDLEEWLLTPEAKRNGAAYVAATRLVVNLGAELDELAKKPAAEEADPTASMTDDQLVGALVQAVNGWPDIALEAVEEAIADRRAGSRLRVISGGGEDA